MVKSCNRIVNKTWPCEKLIARFYGKFEILHHVGSVTYKIALSYNSLVPHVFCSSQLKSAIGPHIASSRMPSQLNENLSCP